jgi:hypothetical protein
MRCEIFQLILFCLDCLRIFERKISEVETATASSAAFLAKRASRLLRNDFCSYADRICYRIGLVNMLTLYIILI